jgi:hypothetical protein
VTCKKYKYRLISSFHVSIKSSASILSKPEFTNIHPTINMKTFTLLSFLALQSYVAAQYTVTVYGSEDCSGDALVTISTGGDPSDCVTFSGGPGRSVSSTGVGTNRSILLFADTCGGGFVNADKVACFASSDFVSVQVADSGEE